MKFTLLTLFPDLVRAYFGCSILNRAVEKGAVAFDVVDIRDFAKDKHRSCDDYSYGGGPGMVLKPEPLSLALESVGAREIRTVYPTPAGRLLSAEYARELANEDELVLICGRYEGIDQRIIDLFVEDEVSIGDYVISSGEIAAMVIVDAVYRLLGGVISSESLVEESFENGLLEYPHYTRPESFQGLRVPDVLLSGHHAQITEWRRQKSIEKTRKYRPELLEKLGPEDGEYRP